MVEVTRAKYPLNPTLKLVTPDGRATAEFFRVLKAIGDLISNITIEDGEIQTEMLEAQIIRVSTLFADEVIITNKIAPNAISELSVGSQVGSIPPDGSTIVSVVVPVANATTTGVILTFTGSQSVPVSGGGNFGTYSFSVYRNGVYIGGSPGMFYDDNFAVFVALQFVDTTPGLNPTYSISASVGSGAGDFAITGSVLNGALFKR